MRSSSRRSFLKRLFGLLPAWGLAQRPEATGARRAARPLRAPATAAGDRADATLTAVAEVVLPAREIGSEGIAEAVGEFRRWSAGFEPAAELDHPYLWSDELRYAPADPRPLWASQLEALDATSREQHQRSFAELGLESRLRLLQEQLPEELPDRLGHASEADHVSLALVAWFVATPRANDLCYRSAIGRHQCRGLPSAVERPTAIAGQDAHRRLRGGGGAV